MAYEDSKLDNSFDKKLGYKEGSKQDNAVDKLVKNAPKVKKDMAHKMKNIHQKHSLLHYTSTGDKAGSDAWVRKAQSGKVMRIM